MTASQPGRAAAPHLPHGSALIPGARSVFPCSGQVPGRLAVSSESACPKGTSGPPASRECRAWLRCCPLGQAGKSWPLLLSFPESSVSRSAGPVKKVDLTSLNLPFLPCFRHHCGVQAFIDAHLDYFCSVLASWAHDSGSNVSSYCECKGARRGHSFLFVRDHR